MNSTAITKKRSTTVVNNYKFRSLLQTGEDISGSLHEVDFLSSHKTKLDLMLGPEDLHHKEFESNYKQFFKVYEGIDRNARFLQTAGQESFKLQKVQYGKWN